MAAAVTLNRFFAMLDVLVWAYLLNPAFFVGPAP